MFAVCSYRSLMGTRVGTWSGTGTCWVAVVRARHGRPPLPPGLHPFFGPHLVVAARYEDSPVGPYLEIAVATPARFGAHVGMCSTTMVVNSREARDAGIEHWGFPKELGNLSWSEDGNSETVRWEERGIELRHVGPAPRSQHCCRTELCSGQRHKARSGYAVPCARRPRSGARRW